MVRAATAVYTVRETLARASVTTQVDEGGETPLMLACVYGQAEQAALLLDRHADPNRQTTTADGGTTALMLAAHGGKAGCVELLLERGANAELQDSFCSRTCSSALAQQSVVLRWSTVELHFSL